MSHIYQQQLLQTPSWIFIIFQYDPLDFTNSKISRHCFYDYMFYMDYMETDVHYPKKAVKLSTHSLTSMHFPKILFVLRNVIFVLICTSCLLQLEVKIYGFVLKMCETSWIIQWSSSPTSILPDNVFHYNRSIFIIQSISPVRAGFEVFCEFKIWASIH